MAKQEPTPKEIAEAQLAFTLGMKDIQKELRELVNSTIKTIDTKQAKKILASIKNL
jgi:hypothetical protein